MPYVPVPKDMSKVKIKVLFGLTKRQIICFGLGALVGFPIYFLVRGSLPNEMSMALLIVVMMPFFFLGMYEKNGLSAEKIVKNWIWTALSPRERVYKTENIYTYLEGRTDMINGGTSKNGGKKGAGKAKTIAGGKGYGVSKKQ
jgi:hypothetical protein